MEEAQLIPVPVWCHTCNSQADAIRSSSDGELECNNCHNNFVEELNQGVESFLQSQSMDSAANSQHVNRSESNATNESNNQNESADSSRENSPIDHSQIIQQILGRVLGINASLPSNLGDDDAGVTVINQISGNTRRPVGIIVRHPTSADETGVSRGIFGLLNSLSAIRSSHNPDALSNAQFEQFLHHLLMNESSHAGAPPATDAAIDQLNKITVNESTDLSTLGECCISQEPFELGDSVVCLPCGHNYKEEPIVHWLKMHRTCPVCRVDINNS